MTYTENLEIAIQYFVDENMHDAADLFRHKLAYLQKCEAELQKRKEAQRAKSEE